MNGGAGAFQSHAIDGSGKDAGAGIVLALHLHQTGHEADDVGEGRGVLRGAGDGIKRGGDGGAEFYAAAGLYDALQGFGLRSALWSGMIGQETSADQRDKPSVVAVADGIDFALQAGIEHRGGGTVINDLLQRGDIRHDGDADIEEGEGGLLAVFFGMEDHVDAAIVDDGGAAFSRSQSLDAGGVKIAAGQNGEGRRLAGSARSAGGEEYILQVAARIEARLGHHFLKVDIFGLRLGEQILTEVRIARAGYIDGSDDFGAGGHQRKKASVNAGERREGSGTEESGQNDKVAHKVPGRENVKRRGKFPNFYCRAEKQERVFSRTALKRQLHGKAQLPFIAG